MGDLYPDDEPPIHGLQPATAVHSGLIGLELVCAIVMSRAILLLLILAIPSAPVLLVLILAGMRLPSGFFRAIAVTSVAVLIAVLIAATVIQLRVCEYLSSIERCASEPAPVARAIELSRVNDWERIALPAALLLNGVVLLGAVQSLSFLDLSGLSAAVHWGIVCFKVGAEFSCVFGANVILIGAVGSITGRIGLCLTIWRFRVMGDIAVMVLPAMFSMYLNK